MIEREKVLANNLLIGDKNSPTYSYKNRNLRSGSLKGSFSLDPIVNELAVDTFQFTVHYDPDAQMIAYSPVDMGNGVYRCAPDGSETHRVPGTLQSSGFAYVNRAATISGDTITMPAGYTNVRVYIQPPSSVRPGGMFAQGDIISFSVSVESVNGLVLIKTNKNTIISNKTGIFSDVSSGYTFNGFASGQQGNDVLTFEYTASGSNYIDISTRGSNMGSDSTSSATISITSLSFNGDLLYGAVGKVYLCRPTNPIPLDKYLTDVPYGTPVWWMCEES